MQFFLQFKVPKNCVQVLLDKSGKLMKNGYILHYSMDIEYYILDYSFQSTADKLNLF